MRNFQFLVQGPNVCITFLGYNNSAFLCCVILCHPRKISNLRHQRYWKEKDIFDVLLAPLEITLPDICILFKFDCNINKLIQFFDLILFFFHFKVVIIFVNLTFIIN